jgi:Tol biopolymer transport system component
LSLALAPSALAGTFPGANGRIAYVQDVGGQPQVFTMSATGRDPRQLTNEAGGAQSPDWSADGRSLAYSVAGKSTVVTDANGGGRRVVNADVNATDPSWSRDGSLFAIAGIDYDPQGNVEDTSIYVLRGDGNGQQRIVDGSNPVWSPDGSWILYTPTPATSDFCPGILAIRPDGTDLHYVVSNYRDDSGNCTGGGGDPSFSPDGKRVVYIGPNGRDLYKVSVYGGTARKLKADADPKHTPIFSPDGQSILFVSGTTRTIAAKKGGHEKQLGPAVSQPAWQALP